MYSHTYVYIRMYECVKRIHVNVCTLPHIHTYIQSNVPSLST
uniref:Uncharacterized protein n=1 Tax=Anguilla anguilla TaxID=7936 RepID=A0A0E9RWC3_ANGAN